MRRDFCMPKLGLTMTEGQLVEWLIAPGDRFSRGQAVYIVETDKAANEVEAEGSGVLLEVVHPAGVTVDVGAVVGHWEEDEASAGASRDPAAVSAAVSGPAAAPELEPNVGAVADSAASAVPGGTHGEGGPAGRIVATPLARRIAQHDNVALSGVTGSGPGGRIKAADVSAHAASARPVASGAHTAAVAEPTGTLRPLGPVRIAPSGAQAAMARRLTAAKQEVPHFYLALEADVAALSTLRAELNQQADPRLTLNDFIVAALGRALLDEPSANRVWSDGGMLQFDTSDVGVAVNTERGLFVPVVRDPGRQSLGDAAGQTRALVDRARAGRLGADEMSGGAVTVSNAGMFDVTYMTPIITPGHAMTMGVGSVRRLFRPDAQGLPSVRSEMGLVLACDHRVLDGVSGLRFLHRVVDYLQKPGDLLTLRKAS